MTAIPSNLDKLSVRSRKTLVLLRMALGRELTVDDLAAENLERIPGCGEITIRELQGWIADQSTGASGYRETTLRDLIELVKTMRKAQRRLQATYRSGGVYAQREAAAHVLKAERSVDTWIRKYDWVGTGKIKREKGE